MDYLFAFFLTHSQIIPENRGKRKDIVNLCTRKYQHLSHVQETSNDANNDEVVKQELEFKTCHENETESISISGILARELFSWKTSFLPAILKYADIREG